MHSDKDIAKDMTLRPTAGPRLTFLKLIREILQRFLISGKSKGNISQNTDLEIGNNKAIIIVINPFSFLHHVGRYYVTLLLNRELVSRAKLCLVSVFTDIVKKIRLS